MTSVLIHLDHLVIIGDISHVKKRVVDQWHQHVQMEFKMELKLV